MTIDVESDMVRLAREIENEIERLGRSASNWSDRAAPSAQVVTTIATARCRRELIAWRSCGESTCKRQDSSSVTPRCVATMRRSPRSAATVRN